MEDNSFVDKLREKSRISRESLEFHGLEKAKKLMQDAAGNGLNSLTIDSNSFDYPKQLTFIGEELRKIGVTIQSQKSSYGSIVFLELKW